MNCDRRSPIVRIPQNMSARKTAQVLLGLPVPPKFDIALLRPDNLPRRHRFETMADAQARQDTELDRFEQIAGAVPRCWPACLLQRRIPCAEVYCPICARLFRRWHTGQALRHQSTLDLQMLTVGLELVTTKRLANFDLRAVKRRAAERFSGGLRRRPNLSSAASKQNSGRMTTPSCFMPTSSSHDCRAAN